MFVQFHALVSYPPSNLNRDDRGRVKTAVSGGATRMRVSSQSLKRAWRESGFFNNDLMGKLGIRTKEVGEIVVDRLVKANHSREQAVEAVRKVIEVNRLGKLKDDGAQTKQLVFIDPIELDRLEALAIRLIGGEELEPQELVVYSKAKSAIDVAMFGRMLADNPANNVEAAVQVAHALSTHRIAVEDDYYTAKDDHKAAQEDATMGAGMMGVVEFASGVLYLYVCVDYSLLVRTLGGDEEKAKIGLQQLGHAIAKISPRGKQATFASRAFSYYMLVERGNEQPRTLWDAFVKPISGTDIMADSISALEGSMQRIDKVYGLSDLQRLSFNTITGEGSLDAVIQFAADGSGEDPTLAPGAEGAQSHPAGKRIRRRTEAKNA